VLWRHVAVLAAMGAALFTFAIARYQQRTG
jgi:hypothetical protein